jgi:hypothetical protein
VLVAVGAVNLTDRIASDPTAASMGGPMDFFSNDGRRLETLALATSVSGRRILKCC